MQCIALLLLSISATPSLAAEPPLLLTHATVIDGTGTPAQANMTIAIEGARISAIYPDGSRTVAGRYRRARGWKT
jgi:hypothetical protein